MGEISDKKQNEDDTSSLIMKNTNSAPSVQKPLSGDKRKLIVILSLLLSVGFAVTSLANYYVSKLAIRESIVANELPLTADNIYSELQKDFIRPIFISSMMASALSCATGCWRGRKMSGT